MAMVRKARHSGSWWKWLAVLVLVLLATLIWHRHEKHTDQEAERNRPPSVTVVLPKLSPKETDLTLPGTLQAIEETSIYARTNGYLAHWYHDIGDTVTKGTLLATIDTPDIDQQLLQTRGVLAQAKATLELNRVTAKRWRALLKENAVSGQEADEKQAAYLAQAATVQSAQADVSRLTYLQSYKKLYAPFKGVITERNVDNGALINAGSTGTTSTSGMGTSSTGPLFRIVKTDTMKIYIGVPESEARAIKPGIKAEVSLREFPGHNFTGVVARSSREIEPTARTLLTEIDIPNPKGELLPGMYAAVKFHFPSPQQSLIVPASVLLIHGSGPQIVTVGADNKLHFVSVTIGRDFGQQTEILQGIDAKSRMVNNPGDTLTEGQNVTIRQKDSEQSEASKEGSEPKAEKPDKNQGQAAPSESKAGAASPKAPPSGDNAFMDSSDKLPDSYQEKPAEKTNAPDKKEKKEK